MAQPQQERTREIVCRLPLDSQPLHPQTHRTYISRPCPRTTSIVKGKPERSPMLREFMGGGFLCSNSDRIAQPSSSICLHPASAFIQHLPSSSICNLPPRIPADANPFMNRLGSKQKKMLENFVTHLDRRHCTETVPEQIQR